MSAVESLDEPVEELENSSFSEIFTGALRGDPTSVRGVFEEDRALPVHDWTRPASDSDRALLRHCRGTTLDVGCGPGRMSAYLSELGHRVLAVDVVREAVDQARRRGVAAMHRNVFDPMPAEGFWDTVLLADGNIGIGGEPAALLERSSALLSPSGRVVVDLSEPGTGLQCHEAHLVTHEKRSRKFPWAQVGPEAIGWLAEAAHLRPVHVGEHHGRWFAVLVP